MQSKRRIRSIESSPLEMDSGGTNYSTFHNQSTQHNSDMPYWFSLLSSFLQSRSSKASQSKNWASLVAIMAILIIIMHKISKPSGDIELLLQPDEIWDHNHYNSKTNRDGQRNMLMVQLSSPLTRSWSHIASRPNRAYARHWGFDYLLSNDSDSDCPAQLLWDIHQRQKQQREEGVAFYDTILFLSPDAIITDMDYDILALLPEDKLVTVTSNNEKLRMINLRHDQFPKLAELWLPCELQHIAAASPDVTTLNPSAAGFVEPRLVKFSNSLTMLHTTADSVCYRYYPRCDVLD